MKRIFTLLLAWTLALGAPLSFGQVTVNGLKTGAAISSGTWANKAEATTVPAGTLLYVTDVGASGSMWQSTGVRWRALNGRATLAFTVAPSASISTTETIVMQAALPAGSWQIGDTLRVMETTKKSGGTDISYLIARIGTACTVADQAITGMEGTFALMAAAGRSSGGIWDIKLMSATTAQKLGSNSASQHAYQGASSTGVESAATTITAPATNNLCITVSMVMAAAAVDTVIMTGGSIELVTP